MTRQSLHHHETPAQSIRGHGRLAPEDRKKQILEEALRYMAETEEDEISPSLLASRLGISRNLVYHYFPNQNSMIAAIIDQLFEELREQVSNTTSDSDDVRERVSYLVNRYVGFMMQHPIVARILVLSPTTGCAFRTKVYEYQSVMVSRLLGAYSADGRRGNVSTPDVMRHAAAASLEFVRQFVVLEATRGGLERTAIQNYCTSVVMKILDDAARLSHINAADSASLC